MARTAARPQPTGEQILDPLKVCCPHCGRRMWADYQNHRTVTTLKQVLRLHLNIRRCPHPDCPRYHKPYRPEAEGAIALPEHEFGLDVIALVGALRYGQHRSVPEIHQDLAGRGVSVCQRTVTNLLDRYDELLAMSLADDARLRKLTGAQGRVILALDGLQPDVGHEVLWVLRDCLSGEVLLARSLLSATTGLWPPVRKGYAWFHKVARILKNEQGLAGAKVRKRLGGLLGTIRRDGPRKGRPAHATAHFLKVTASYWKGLFHCYDVPDLPRTNNDLEHLFGSNRYHERRSTGRKSASPAMVLRGPVRLLAATATRLKPPAAGELTPADVQAWRELRRALDQRRAARTLRRRFRKDPGTYLRETEAQLLQPALPP